MIKINNNELIIKSFLESQGHSVKRLIKKYYPDFLIDEEYYVEHKQSGNLINNQILSFSKLDKLVYIIRTINGIIQQDLELFEKKEYNLKHTKSFIITINAELWRKFKIMCINQDKYMENVIIGLIEKFVNDNHKV